MPVTKYCVKIKQKSAEYQFLST